MRATATTLCLALLTLLCLAASASAKPVLTPIGSFDKPVQVTAPAGDPHRLFVVQNRGVVKIVRDGTVVAQPFMDVSADLDPDRVGLASIAFAPDYATSGYVYVLYDAPDAAGTTNGVDVVVDRYTRSADDPDRVDPATKLQILRLDYSNTHDHDADHLEFGPDGMLYITIGEGLDTPDSAQDKHAMRGKLLRIDVRPDGSYAIPRGNPYAAGSAGDPRVFAYGLRNPWRFSIDFEHRNVVVGDVGDGGGEEVDVLNIDTGGGANLGWPCWEGNHTHNTGGVCNPTPPVQQPPVFEYEHTNNRCAIIGGVVVRDPNVPTLLGKYLYGDFCTGEIRSLDLQAATPANTDADTTLRVGFFGFSSFGQDGCGHAFATNINSTDQNVWRIDDDSATYAPCPEPSPPPAGQPPPAGTPPANPGDGGQTPTPGPSPEPGPAPTPEDKTAPRLWVTGARAQRVVRNRHVVIAVRCDEPCHAAATAHATGLRSAKRQFQVVTRSLPALSRTRFSLRLSSKTRAALRRLVRRGQRPLIRVRVTARDAAGNPVTRTRYVVAVG